MATEFIAPVRGANFRTEEEKAVCAALHANEPVDLQREASNPYDENAIMVLKDQHHIGYVGKEFAADIAPLMDNGFTYTCIVDHFAGAISPVVHISFSDEPVAA